jgi:alkanesulfonate monooxygenase
LPQPVQSPRPPIIVGGHGTRRTPRLAARFADEFNVPFAPYEDARSLFGLVDGACTAIDRDPSSLRRSVALVVCCGRDDGEISRRAANIKRNGEELSQNGLAGTPAQLIEKIATYRTLGVSRIYLQVLDISDLDHVALIADEVLSQVAD